VPEGVWPPSFAPRLVELRRQAAARPNRFGGNPATRERDQVTEQVAAALAREGFDLTLVYFRGVDIASHNYWRYFRPAGFPEPDPAMAAAHGDEVPRVYEATDAAIGRIAAAAPQANLIVVSDHGFRRLPGEEAIVSLSFDRVLERLGYLAYGRRGQVDLDRTRIRTWSSPTARLKRLRYCLAGRDPGGRVLPDERAALRAALERDLARLTWPGGEPAFRLRDPRPREAQEGADLVVAMLAGAEAPLYLDRRPQPGLVQVVARISGTHGGNTNGIFFAVGPDVRRGAALEQIHVQDLAPTILFALGLPVADDFAGKPQVELFTPELRRRQPLRRIRTWGAPRSGRTTMSTADQELVRELRALGYL
jgi:predicted AlkP superfamily phosphohydrolase/phosphomutase